MRPLISVLALVAVAAVGGCSASSAGSSGSPVARVASVPHASSEAGPTPTRAVERPLIRMDSTPDEIDEMFRVYTKCLTDHGVPPKSEAVRSKNADPHTKGVAACAAKEPDDYRDKLKREHPAEFRDKQRTQVACMKAHGLKIQVDEDGWGYLDPAHDMGSAWDHKCEQRAFGG